MARSMGRLGVVLLAIAFGLAACTEAERVAADPCDDHPDPVSCRRDQLSGPDDLCRWILVSEAEATIGYGLAGPGRAFPVSKCFNVASIPGVGGDDARFEYAMISDEAAAGLFASAVASLRSEPRASGRQTGWDPSTRTLHVLFKGHYLWILMPAVEDAEVKAVRLAGLALDRLSPEAG